MKKNWKIIIGLMVGATIIALILFKLKSNKEISESNIYQYDKEQAQSVIVDTISLSITNFSKSYTGTFEACKESNLSAEIQGKIIEVNAEVGHSVQRGQKLIQLDNSLLRLQLASVEIQIESFETDVERYTILSKADAVQGIQLEKALLGLRSAKIQKSILIEQINKTTITAPFAGIITAKFTEVGAFAAPGAPLLQVTDITQLKFTLSLSENELPNFDINQPYNVIADAYPEISFTGKLSMIGSKANKGNNFPVEIGISNTNDLKIKAGMFGKVILRSEMPRQGIAIPSTSIQRAEIRPQVYLLQNGKAVLQNIEVSHRTGSKAIVTQGLTEGDVIVTSGFINLFEGANVNIKQNR